MSTSFPFWMLASQGTFGGILTSQTCKGHSDPIEMFPKRYVPKTLLISMVPRPPRCLSLAETSNQSIIIIINDPAHIRESYKTTTTPRCKVALHHQDEVPKISANDPLLYCQ
jgi:hypothetical protein